MPQIQPEAHPPLSTHAPRPSKHFCRRVCLLTTCSATCHVLPCVQGVSTQEIQIPGTHPHSAPSSYTSFHLLHSSIKTAPVQYFQITLLGSIMNQKAASPKYLVKTIITQISLKRNSFIHQGRGDRLLNVCGPGSLE